MGELDLDAIRARAENPRFGYWDTVGRTRRDVLALVAEVERLRQERDDARTSKALLRDDFERGLAILTDLVVKGTPHGEQQGEFVAFYIFPTGPIHRAIPYLDEHGINARPGFDPRTKDGTS